MGKPRNPFLVLLLTILIPLTLVIVGTGIIGASVTDNPEPQPDEVDLGSLLLGLFVLLAGIAMGFALVLTWYYKVNREMIELHGQDWNVGLWTFLGLIPIVQIVSLYKFADHINFTHRAQGITGMGTVPMFLLLLLMLPVGITVAQVQVNKVW